MVLLLNQALPVPCATQRLPHCCPAAGYPKITVLTLAIHVFITEKQAVRAINTNFKR